MNSREPFMSSDISLLFLQKMLFKIAMKLIILGSLNWLIIGAFRVNLVERLLGKGVLTRSIYIIIGLAAVAIMFYRDTYLPFLGETVLPCSGFADRVPPGATKEVHLSVEPGSKVLYWAAEPAMEELKQINNWQQAYVKYQNSGVATADENGVAILKVRAPQPYTVPFMGRLESHVHYRVCGENGMLSRVKTFFVDSGKIDSF